MKSSIFIGLIILLVGLGVGYFLAEHDKIIKSPKPISTIAYNAPIGPTKEPPLYRLKSEALIDGD